MRGFIAFLLLISSYVAAAAESPCYFAGNFVKCFPITGVWLDSQRSLRLGDAGTANYVEIKAPAAVTTYSVIYPPSQGAANTRLRNNGSGTLVWSLVALATDVSGQLLTANGGTGQNSTATFPTSGTVVTEAAVETLTNKTMGSTNILTGSTAASFTNGAATITLPVTTSTLSTLALVETLTNKTLTAPVIATISNTGTLTLPTSTDTLVGRNTTDTLTNKTLTAPAITGGSALQLTDLTVKDTSTAGYMRILVDSGMTPATTRNLTINMNDASHLLTLNNDLTITRALTVNGTGNVTLTSQGTTTATLPITGTLATLAGVESLTNKTLDSTSTITGAAALNLKSGAATITLPTSTSTLATLALGETLTNKTMGSTNTLTGATATNFTSGAATVTLPTTTSTLATLALAETLTNKTMGSTNTLTGAVAVNLTSGAATVTLPTTTSTLATLALAETLTNKTMGSTNTLTGATASSFTNTGTVTLPTSTDTLVARNTVDTLTNKTISGASNTLTVRLANDVTGTLPTGNGGTNKPTWTLGSIPYLSSTTAFNEDNANFFWDGTNHRLGIGTATPQKMLESSASSAVVQWRLTDTAVAHGITTGLATTTIGQIGDASVDGGIEFDSFAQSTTQGMILKGVNVTASTTIPIVELRAGKKSGTTVGNAAASDMLYSFSKNDGTALVTMTGDGVTNFTAGLKIAGSSTLGTFTRGSKSTTFQSDGTSSVATAAVTVQYYRIDDWVTVFFPALTFSGVTAATGYIGTGGPSNINNLTAIDSFARPATVNQESLCVPWTLGTTKQAPVGRMLINTSGVFTLNRDNAVTSFPNGDNTTGTNVSNTNAFSCSYYVGTGS